MGMGGPGLRFVPCSAPSKTICPAHESPISLKVGDPVLHAFQFPGQKIAIGTKNQIKSILRQNAERLREFPFLRVDVLAS